MPNSDTTTNVYDAGGIRKKKTAPNSEETESFYSGLPTISEVEDASGTPVDLSYLMGHQLLGFDRDGTFSYFLTDGLSSVRVLTNASGVETASWEYTEFGTPTKSGSEDSPKSYVGGLGITDETANTSLHYVRQRWYDHGIGRFLNRDPIGFAGGLNLYKYGFSNPLNSVDPSGNLPWVFSNDVPVHCQEKIKKALESFLKKLDEEDCGDLKKNRYRALLQRPIRIDYKDINNASDDGGFAFVKGTETDRIFFTFFGCGQDVDIVEYFLVHEMTHILQHIDRVFHPDHPADMFKPVYDNYPLPGNFFPQMIDYPDGRTEQYNR